MILGSERIEAADKLHPISRKNGVHHGMEIALETTSERRREVCRADRVGESACACGYLASERSMLAPHTEDPQCEGKTREIVVTGRRQSGTEAEERVDRPNGNLLGRMAVIADPVRELSARDVGPPLDRRPRIGIGEDDSGQSPFRQ